MQTPFCLLQVFGVEGKEIQQRRAVPALCRPAPPAAGPQHRETFPQLEPRLMPGGCMCLKNAGHFRIHDDFMSSHLREKLNTWLNIHTTAKQITHWILKITSDAMWLHVSENCWMLQDSQWLYLIWENKYLADNSKINHTLYLKNHIWCQVVTHL